MFRNPGPGITRKWCRGLYVCSHKKEKKVKLTKLEQEVLESLIPESESNGHDFGVLEMVRWPDRRQLGAVITNLQKKGVIVDFGKTEVDGGIVTQYVLADEYKCETTEPEPESDLPPSPSQQLSPSVTANREQWLTLLMTNLASYMEEVEPSSTGKMAAWRVSCGWPGGGSRRKRIGECWSQTCSKGGMVEMFISPLLESPGDIDHVLLHEMVHASVGTKCGHRGPFAKLARKLGLKGKLTSTFAGPELRERLDAIVADMPAYPHSAINPKDVDRKVQSTRMVKCRCDECGYIIRTTRKWLDKGVPFCFCGGNFEMAS